MDSIQAGGFIVNILMMLIAIVSSFISYLIYKENSNPDIIVYLEQDEDAKTIINLVIKNIGKSPARDITFSLNKKLPQRAYAADHSSEMTEGALITGIPFLAPGASRESMLGNYQGLQNWLKGETVSVNTKFYKANSRSLLKTSIVNTSFLEVHSFARSSAGDNSSGSKIVTELKNINKSLSKIKV